MTQLLDDYSLRLIVLAQILHSFPAGRAVLAHPPQLAGTREACLRYQKSRYGIS